MSAPTSLREKLVDLLEQATTERSHYYVASVVRDCISNLDLSDILMSQAVERITELQIERDTWKAVATEKAVNP